MNLRFPRAAFFSRDSTNSQSHHVSGSIAFIVTLLLIGLLGLTSTMGQIPTAKQKQSLNRIKTKIDRAGKQFNAKNFRASRDYIDQAIKQLDSLAPEAGPELIELIKPEYRRLTKAHQLLTAAGQKPKELKAFPRPVTEKSQLISFKKSVAPILVAKCGNCHVNRAQGNFSTATFEALEQSTMLAYGLPDDSRLIQVIESGEMPKDGAKIEPEQLKTLQDWVKQGAKFDGEDIRQNLNEFVAAPARPGSNTESMVLKTPTGKETVSFGLHVVPILLNNCGRCHINDDPRGNFSMYNFRSLLAGGDGGTTIEPGSSAESQIIKRLRGDGVDVMPPTGKLDDDQIDTIAKWIDEGAAFDGGDPQLATRIVGATAQAKSQTHDELAADRKALAAETWKLVMDDVESNTLPGKNFLVTGSTSESRLADVAILCEKLFAKIASALRADSTQPLIKGNVSVFVFERRYDFNEFGKMVVQRDFPKEVSAHWGFTTIDAFATVLMSRNQTHKDVQADLAYQIAALYTANLAPDIPRWFADGVGLWTAKKILAKEDSMVSLDSRAAAAAASMINLDDFVQNRMPSDQAALVSYLFIKELRSESAAYRKLMKSLADGKSFKQSFELAFGGTPSQLLGQKNDSTKNRRNR